MASFGVENPGARVVGTSTGAFWDAERSWQSTMLESTFEATVTNPQTVGGMLKSYTTYLITTKTTDGVTETRRRFSDFDWLREVLAYRFHGIAIPVLPAKRMVGNSDSAFIEDRRRGLERWVRQVASNPYLRQDTTLRTFLTLPAGSEWDQARKAVVSGGGGANPSENPGLARWFGVLRAYPLPEDAPAAVAELQDHMDKTQKLIEATLKAAHAYHSAATTMADAAAMVRESVSAWGVSVSSDSDSPTSAWSSTLSNLREPTSEMQGVLGVSSKAFGEVADLAAFSPNEVSLFLIDGLEAELRSVGAFKDLLEVRRRAEADYASAFKTQDTLQFKERQLREKGHAEKVQAIATKVAEAVSVTQRMNERLQDITKGIINCEAGKELRGRVNRIRSVLGQFAALGIASGERAQQVWTTFLTDSALDQGTMVSKAQATLTGNPSVTFEDGGLPSQSHLGDAEAAGGAGGAAAVMGGAGGAEAAAPASEEVTEL